LVWGENKVAVEQHAGGKVAHYGFSLDMQISKHLVGAPASEEADDIGVHLCAQEGHRARGTKGPSGDVGG
jgi:hypothetical protein